MGSKTQFTIGEISKLYNIAVKTLRYYDSVDLFKPAEVNYRTNYRYYSIDQFEMLNSIKFLRHMGFSIQDIKNHIKTKDSLSFKEKLIEYKNINEAEIKRLQAVTNSLEERIYELENAEKNTDFGNIKIISHPDRSILYLNETISDIMGLELNLRKLENQAEIDPSIIIGRIGLTVSEENLKKNIFDEYNSIFILKHSAIENKYSRTIKGGEYVTVSINSGGHEDSPSFYRKIFRFLSDNNYEICGDAVERVIIDSFITNNTDQYLTIIEIPVRKSE